MASAENLNKRFFAGNLPESYDVGERLRASTVNTLMDAVRQLARTGEGLGIDTPVERPQLIFAQNSSGADIGSYQMVEITDSALYNPLKAIIVDSPSAASVELTAITEQPIPNGASGWVYTCGVALVEYTGAAATGDRLGSQNGSTVAIADLSSAWVVLGVTVIGGKQYALVRFQPGGGAGAVGSLITTSLAATKIADGDWIDLSNFTLPEGKGMHIIYATISKYNGVADAGFDLEAYNVSDANSMYETSEAVLQSGTPTAPLNATDAAIGDAVTIRAENNSGGDTYINAYMSFVIVTYFTTTTTSSSSSSTSSSSSSTPP